MQNQKKRKVIDIPLNAMMKENQKDNHSLHLDELQKTSQIFINNSFQLTETDKVKKSFLKKILSNELSK